MFINAFNKEIIIITFLKLSKTHFLKILTSLYKTFYEKH